MKLATVFVLLAPCLMRGCGPDTPLTQETAVAQGEKALAEHIKANGDQRARFGAPIVTLSNGDALIEFRDIRYPSEGVTVSAGKDGCVSLSPTVGNSP